MVKWTENDEAVLIEFVKSNPIIYDPAIRDPGSKRDTIKGLFENFTQHFFSNRIPSEQVRARWQKLRSYYIVLMKNKLNSVDTRGNFKEDVNFRWKHLNSMSFLEPFVKLINDQKAKNDADPQDCQGDSDNQHFMLPEAEEEEVIAESPVNIKQEIGISDSIVQDSFEPLRYCAVGLQNSLVEADVDGSNEQDDQNNEENADDVKMENLSLMYQEQQRRRGRPRKRGIMPVTSTSTSIPTTSTPLLKKRRGRPKGYSPLKKAKFLQQQQEIQQELLRKQQQKQANSNQRHYANGESSYYNNHASTSYLQMMDDSNDDDTINESNNLIPPPQLHKIPTETNHQSKNNTNTNVPTTSVTATSSAKYPANGQPATSTTTTDVSKDQQESDHMAQILMSLLSRCHPLQRTELFIQMLELCKNYMQVN